MQKDTKIQAKHKLNGTIVEFTLVATPLKRVKEGSEVKHYPWFAEAEATFDNAVTIFGREMLEEMAMDALQREFQLIYFQKSPSWAPKAVLKNGKPAMVVNKEGKEIPVITEDDTPRMERFLEMIEDENLSGREITSEYCMRKAINIQTGVDKKWKEKSEIERSTEAMKWMLKAQELMAQALAKAEKK